MEEALHDIPAMRGFALLDVGDDLLPDESTILRFRHRLEKHGLADRLLAEINALLEEKGLLLREGTIVDATLTAAPNSTENNSGSRDPEMHQTKKGKTWHFDMEAHIGVDEESGLTHTIVTTAANVNDVTQAHALLHGEEKRAYGDAGYQGVEKRPENCDSSCTCYVALRPGKLRTFGDDELGQVTRALETRKASIRAKVERPFRIIKRQFGYLNTRYRGLPKNTGQVVTLFALANLFQAPHRLLALAGEVCP
jgi:IS5 family transposase